MKYIATAIAGWTLGLVVATTTASSTYEQTITPLIQACVIVDEARERGVPLARIPIAAANCRRLHRWTVTP